MLERLLVDPHIDVVDLLLKNPRLTEDDVLRIATARRASAAMLELILHNRRWACRARVRRALLHNPNLPEADALRLVGLFNRTELRELSGDQSPVQQRHLRDSSATGTLAVTSCREGRGCPDSSARGLLLARRNVDLARLFARQRLG